MWLNTLDLIAFIYMLIVWLAYAHYAKYTAKYSTNSSLSRTLKKHRVAWVERMLEREIRVGDSSLLANQERIVGFFASTTVLLLAAVITAFTSTDTIRELTSHLPFATTQTNNEIEIKFFLLALILVYAFFMVTWSLREYGFVSVLMGSAPNFDEKISTEERQAVVQNIARLLDAAGHDNNSGLRAYYFGTAMLFWLFNTWFYIAITTLVVMVLYQREFRSRAIRSMGDAYIPPKF